MPKQVHVVSHGPHCLDGVAAAVAVARYQQGRAEVVPHFAGNSEVDGVRGSRGVAWGGWSRCEEAYPGVVAVDEQVAYRPRMAAARARVEAECAHSLSVANASRSERPLAQATLVTAVWDGHPSEIADG